MHFSLFQVVKEFDPGETGKQELIDTVAQLDFLKCHKLHKSREQNDDSADEEEEPTPDAPPFTFAITVAPDSIHWSYFAGLFTDNHPNQISDLYHLICTILIILKQRFVVMLLGNWFNSSS